MKKTIVTGVIIGILCVSGIFAYGNNRVETPEKSNYPTNENGASYGVAPDAAGEKEEPDLIAAVGENDVKGYVKKSDLDNDGDVKTPEEALKRQKELEKKEYISIPLYKNNGKTVIGEFRLSTQNEQKLY
ncbi:hypothetical protein NE619_16950 [Anaerovorax odorimutans]|uniref:EF-hand domain-containing protein n=1 Tax=Anaerovorax odorimutans TaxID=109327 RepID=A0ABT1RT87_9FIRM|nr:hypothetical protein [Anaerovorax odorimutans]MCQ4638421.1 hypothetical protein [Anaerovorax odorimutans]